MVAEKEVQPHPGRSHGAFRIPAKNYRSSVDLEAVITRPVNSFTKHINSIDIKNQRHSLHAAGLSLRD